MRQVIGAQVNVPIRREITLLTANEIARLVVFWAPSLSVSEDDTAGDDPEYDQNTDSVVDDTHTDFYTSVFIQRSIPLVMIATAV